jgi:acetyl esterase/lipase
VISTRIHPHDQWKDRAVASHPLRETFDLTYGTGNGHDLNLDILRPAAPLHPLRPAVVWVHGGGWRAGERQPHPNRVLAERGFVTATISYRLSDEAISPAQIHDVKAALRYLRATSENWGIDAERIGIWGHSAGGHLAALAAVSEGISTLEGEGGHPEESSAVQAAVPLSPPTDFLVDWYATSDLPTHEEALGAVVEFLGGDPLSASEVADRAKLASPVRLVQPDAPPMLVVHGTLDDLVPVAQGRLLVEALLDVGCDASLLELPHDDHGLTSVFSEHGMVPVHLTDHAPITPAMQEIVRFFERTLGPLPSLSTTT